MIRMETGSFLLREGGFTVPLRHSLSLIQKYNELIVLMGEYAIAVLQCHSKFLVFDSHGRLENGSAHGNAWSSFG